jgi:hypothetical protein
MSFRSSPRAAVAASSAAAAIVALAFGSLLVSPADAALPPPAASDYSFGVQARAATGGSGFNVPNGTSWTSISPQINDSGTVGFRIQIVGGTSSQPGVWQGARDAGSVKWLAPSDSLIVGDVSQNNAGNMVFPLADASPDGIYFYNAATQNATLFTNGPLGASAWSPRLNNPGNIASRTTFGSSTAQAYVSYPPGSMTPVATHALSVDAGGSYPFLFTPSLDDTRTMTAPVRERANGVGANTVQADRIRRFEPDGSTTLVAEDRDNNPASPYFQFDNFVGVSDSGEWTAFVARTTSAGSSRTLFLTNGLETRTVAAPGGGVNSIDNFAPAVNDDGLVVFRATDTSGNISLFVGDGTTLPVRLLGVTDSIQTDLGLRTLSFLGGGPDINNNGDVVFGAQLNNGGNVIIAGYIPEPAAMGLAIGAIIPMMLRRRPGH